MDINIALTLQHLLVVVRRPQRYCTPSYIDRQ